MPLFGRSKQLPTTSYGYTPPPEATAVGWRCTSCWRAGETGDVPRRWPHPCVQCGRPADPTFAEPWAHEARGVELRHQIATGEGMVGFPQADLAIWRCTDALRRGDHAGADAVRAEFWANDELGGKASRSPYGPSQLVFHECREGDFARAAEDLLRWLDASRADGDAVERDNCKQAVGAAVRFLETPGGSAEPQAGAILERARTLGVAAEEYLSHPTLVGLQRLLGL